MIYVTIDIVGTLWRLVLLFLRKRPNIIHTSTFKNPKLIVLRVLLGTK